MALALDAVSVLVVAGLLGAPASALGAEGVRFDRYRAIEARARTAGRGSWRRCPDFAD